MKKSIILLAIFALIFASCKKTEIIEINEVKQENVTLKNNKSPDNPWEVKLCFTKDQKLGWHCLYGERKHCYREFRECRPFHNVPSEKATLIELIYANIEEFNELYDNGTLIAEPSQIINDLD